MYFIMNYSSVNRHLPPRRAFGSASNTTTSYCLPPAFQHNEGLVGYGRTVPAK